MKTLRTNTLHMWVHSIIHMQNVKRKLSDSRMNDGNVEVFEQEEKMQVLRSRSADQARDTLLYQFTQKLMRFTVAIVSVSFQ